jgi:hypothetical protein
MVGYVYNTDKNELVVQIYGFSNTDIELEAEKRGYMNCSDHCLSYNSDFYFSTHNDCNDPEHGGCGACER